MYFKNFIVGIHQNKKQHFIASVLILLILIGGVSWGYFNPEKETITSQDKVYDFDISINNEAKAVSNTSLYEKGEVIKNSKIIQLKAFERVNFTVDIDNNLPQETDPKVNLTTDLVAYSQQAEFWSKRLISKNLSDSEQKEFYLNLNYISSKDRRISDENRNTISTKTVIKFKPKINNKNLETKTVNLNIGPTIAKVNHDYKDISYSRTETKIEAVHTSFPMYMLVFMILIILVLIYMVIISFSTKWVDEVDIWNYNIKKHKNEIRNGVMEPNQTGVNTKVKVGSVNEIIDISYDCREAVLKDDRTETVYVIDKDTLYYSRKPDAKGELFW